MISRPSQIPRTRYRLGAAWWLLGLALLGTVLLHGCHGPDEDHELFRASDPESVWLVN